MRVLLDENLDWRLVRYFDADFQVTTVIFTQVAIYKFLGMQEPLFIESR